MSEKIIFMGTPNFSVPILKSLHDNNYKIEAIYTQPPKKKLRPPYHYDIPSRCAALVDSGGGADWTSGCKFGQTNTKYVQKFEVSILWPTFAKKAKKCT